MRSLNLEDAEFIAHELASRLMRYDEPIPDLKTRFPGRLESCLGLPFQYINGKPAYLRFTRKAAVMFYCVIKDHPFLNGNKRMAVTLTLVFFFQNRKWLDIDPDALYKIACDVAGSSAADRNRLLDNITRLFNEFATSL